MDEIRLYTVAVVTKRISSYSMYSWAQNIQQVNRKKRVPDPRWLDPSRNLPRYFGQLLGRGVETAQPRWCGEMLVQYFHYFFGSTSIFDL